MKKFINLVPVVVLAATCGLAAAKDAPYGELEVRSKTVTFSRPAAQSTQGAKLLYVRLRSAAHEVCSDGGFPRGSVRWEIQTCAAKAVDGAVREINVPALTALHERRGTVEVMASR